MLRSRSHASTNDWARSSGNSDSAETAAGVASKVWVSLAGRDGVTVCLRGLSCHWGNLRKNKAGTKSIRGGGMILEGAVEVEGCRLFYLFWVGQSDTVVLLWLCIATISFE